MNNESMAKKIDIAQGKTYRENMIRDILKDAFLTLELYKGLKQDDIPILRERFNKDLAGYTAAEIDTAYTNYHKENDKFPTAHRLLEYLEDLYGRKGINITENFNENVIDPLWSYVHLQPPNFDKENYELRFMEISNYVITGCYLTTEEIDLINKRRENCGFKPFKKYPYELIRKEYEKLFARPVFNPIDFKQLMEEVR